MKWVVHGERKVYESPWVSVALADVEVWFASTDTAWPFAFESICDTLELDAAAIRAHLAPGVEEAPIPARFPFRRACGRPVSIRLRRRNHQPAAENPPTTGAVAAHGLRGHGV